MASQSEITNSHLALRIIAGLLAIAALISIPVNLLETFANKEEFRAMDILKIAGVFYGIYLLGHYAVKGKLPISRGREA